jgi:hypothetical protein
MLDTTPRIQKQIKKPHPSFIIEMYNLHTEMLTLHHILQTLYSKISVSESLYQSVNKL